MKNNILKAILFLIISIFIQGKVFAENENTLPVTTSYSDAIKEVQSQLDNNQAKPQTQSPKIEQTLANQAVNGTLGVVNNSEIQNNESLEVQPIKEEIIKQTKPKKSIISIVFKFVLAMIWVCISSIFIFIILLSYKRLILKGRRVIPTYESTEESLDAPKNFKEAIKLFLDKTKWN